MATAMIFGPAYSTYTRTARLAMEEKGAEYRLEEVDLLGGASGQPAHLARQPFGKVPAFQHDGMAIYETVAIIRYIDRVFPGPSLQPSDPAHAARMDQVMSIVDSYAYGALIGKVFWQRAVVPMQGEAARSPRHRAGHARLWSGVWPSSPGSRANNPTSLAPA
jgi:glutathione S-transferase